MKHTKVAEIMTRNPVMIDPEDTLQTAAEKMQNADCGVLPVGQGNSIGGMITDRDIVVRAVARGKDVKKEKVRDYMTGDVISCKETDSIAEAAKIMGDNQVNRLIVQGEDQNISGILTFGCILRKTPQKKETTKAVQEAVKRYVA